MASGKIVRLGKYRINFSSKGVATKNDETGVVRKYPFPWVKYRLAKEAQEREYEEQGYEQEYDQGYDPRQQEEQPYDLPYDEEAGEYADPEEEYAPQGALFENEWLMWLLLIVLPPLGIWVLWRRNRFQITARSAISAASCIWCVVLLVWLFSGLGSNEDPKTPQLPSDTPLSFADNATVSPTPDQNTPQPDTTGVPANVGVSATAQPDDALTSATDAPTTMPTTVWATPTGKHYHTNSTCDGMQNASLVSLSVCLTRGQTACPTCFSSDASAEETPVPTPNTTTNADGTVETIYYHTPNGTYYHILPNCGMKTSIKTTKAEAESIGQTPCPTCIGSVYWTDGGKNYHTISNCQGMKNAKMTTISEAQLAGKTACSVCAGGTITEGSETNGTEYYWCTDTGTYYHSNSTCTGMKNASKVTAEAAEANGKTACPKCVGSSGAAIYYATPTGTYFHANSTCTGMKNATKVSMATATGRGQKPCPDCLPGLTTVTTTTGSTTGTTTASGTVTFYSTKDGTYFHTRQDCSGMKSATAVTEKEIAARGQTACPKCIGTAGTYYSTKDGTYYHAKATCTGMKGATIVTLAQIQARGQTACPTCLGGTKKTETTTTTTTTTSTGTGDYWHTANGKNYHSKADCNGMANATRTTAAAAEKQGQTACPDCIGSYWHTATGTYYHAKSSCSGMSGATRTTAAAAKKLGQTACPKCIGGGSKPAATATPKPDTSDKTDKTDKVDPDTTNVYVTIEGSYYHTTKSCGGMKNAASTTLRWALDHNYKRCKDCNAPSAE